MKICFLIFLFCPFCLHSQEAKFNIRYYSVGNELTSGNIREILQDKYGFIWIATQDGLFRHDSKKFTPYNSHLHGAQQIGGSDVRNLHVETDSGLIWSTSSYLGINAINLTTGQVVKYYSQDDYKPLRNNVIKGLFVTPNTIFLGCEKGFFKLDKSTRKLTEISVPGLQLVDGFFEDISEITKDRLLVMCRNKGLYIYNIQSGKIEQYLPILRPINIGSPYRFHNTTINRNGLILITTTYELLLYRFDSAVLVRQTNTKLNKALLAFKDHIVSRAVFDKDDNLWIASNRGLFVVKGDSVTKVSNNDERNHNNDWLTAIYALYPDTENNMWLGCQNGLAYLTNSTPAFINHAYSSKSQVGINHSYHLFPFNDSIIYSTAEEGLYKINRNNNFIEVIERGRTYDFIFEDPFGRLIASNFDGLFVLIHNKAVPISSIYPKFTLFSKTRINSCISINDSCLAMGTENINGILVWNHKVNKVEQFTTESTSGRLIEDDINTLYALSKNKFLVLSDASLSLFDYTNRTVKQLVLNDPTKRTPANIFFDACKIKDTLFIACYGKGVLKLNDQFSVAGTINVSQGLSNNGVYKILPWRDSLLFITTNNGLNVYYPGNGRVRSFYKEDGLHDNGFEETSGVIYKDHILAGGINGFTAIFPDRIRSNSMSPVFYIGNVSVKKPRDSTVNISNLFIDKYNVPLNANQTTIYFPSINYINPERVTFQYRIAEVDKGWIDRGSQNFIDLVPMDPKTYHIHIRAINEDGVVSQEKTIQVTFPPKWYQTGWFQGLLALFVFSIIYVIYRIRINQLRKEHRIRTKLASDLHDDLGSTLNSVKIYANLAMIEKSDKYFIKVGESIQEAIVGIRDIIWVLDASKDDLDNLISRINAFAGPLCEANHILYKYEVDDQLRYNKLRQEERRNLYMMLKEAINNSIKYSGAKEITVKADRARGQLCLKVTDNGMGFDAAKMSEGNGLRNMQRRTKEINYNISVQSSLGKGTIIDFWKNSH